MMYRNRSFHQHLVQPQYFWSKITVEFLEIKSTREGGFGDILGQKAFIAVMVWLKQY